MHIQVMKIFKLSFRNAWSHKLEWFRVAFAPLVIWALGAFVMGLTYWSIGYPLKVHEAMLGQTQYVSVNIDGGAYTFSILAQIFYFIAYLIAILNLFIKGFRYGVLEEGGQQWWTLHFNKRFGKMLLYFFLIQIPIILYTVLAAGVVWGTHYFFANMILDSIIGALFALYGFYVLFRVSLFYLLIAIDKTHPLRTSWHLLKGNVLRLLGLLLLIILSIFGIFLLGAIVLGLLGALLELISPWFMGGIAVLLSLFGLFMWFMLWATTTKASAFVYKILSEGKVL